MTIPHEMSRSHYISFILAVKDNGTEIVKLYPEGNAEARFKISRTQGFYYFCNQHGLFKVPVCWVPLCRAGPTRHVTARPGGRRS